MIPVNETSAFRAMMFHFGEVLEQFRVAGISEHNIHQFERAFTKMVNTDGATPNDFFPFIACGSFKECYGTWIDGWVIKFCVDHQQFLAEQAVLKAAAAYGIEDAFVASTYIAMPTSNLTYFIDPDDFSGDGWNDDGEKEPSVESLPIIGCVIQPEVTPQGNLPYEVLSFAGYEENPILGNHGNPLEFDLLTTGGIDSRDWFTGFISFHGDKYFNRLLRFIDDFNITDLHAGNIGYMDTTSADSVPVILDWLSRDIHPDEDNKPLQLTLTDLCD